MIYYRNYLQNRRYVEACLLKKMRTDTHIVVDAVSNVNYRKMIEVMRKNAQEVLAFCQHNCTLRNPALDPTHRDLPPIFTFCEDTFKIIEMV